MTGILIVIGFFFALFIGSRLGKRSVAHDCQDYGGFTYGDYFYECIVRPIDEPEYGLPDAIAEHSKADINPFAENTLDKVKFLKQSTKDSLAKGESSGLAIFPDGMFTDQKEEHDCLHCQSDANELSRRMILCKDCGNKRCPKAQNHRFNCTGSNVIGQIGNVDSTADQKRLDGSSIVHQTVLHDIGASSYQANTFKSDSTYKDEPRCSGPSIDSGSNSSSDSYSSCDSSSSSSYSD